MRLKIQATINAQLKDTHAHHQNHAHARRAAVAAVNDLITYGRFNTVILISPDSARESYHVSMPKTTQLIALTPNIDTCKDPEKIAGWKIAAEEDNRIKHYVLTVE